MNPIVTSLLLLLSGQTKPPVTALAFCPGGKQVVAGSQEGLRLLGWPELAETGRPECRLAHINALIFSPNGAFLLAAGGRPGEAGEVEILSWPGLKALARKQAHTDLVYGAAWSNDGESFITGGADNTCAVFQWKPGTEPKQAARYLGHSKPVVAVAFLPDGKQVVSASVDQSIQLWDPRTARQEKSMDNHLRPISDLAVRPPGVGQTSPAMVATTGEDRTVRLWQPAVGRLVRFIRLGSIPRVARWSNTGDTLVAGCDDGQVLWLDPESGTLAPRRIWDAKVGRVHAMAIHPETGRVLTGGDKGLATATNP